VISRLSAFCGDSFPIPAGYAVSSSARFSASPTAQLLQGYNDGAEVRESGRLSPA
jgi:hypothetical protein